MKLLSNIKLMKLYIFLEAFIVGIITYVIGIIVFNLSINKKNKDRENPIGLHIAFFSTGFLLHFIVELIGFNKYMCDKQCS